jgi:hypothetical protein
MIPGTSDEVSYEIGAPRWRWMLIRYGFYQFALRKAAMDNTPTDCTVVHETVVFLKYFNGLYDLRQQGKVCYPLVAR